MCGTFYSFAGRRAWRRGGPVIVNRFGAGGGSAELPNLEDIEARRYDRVWGMGILD